MPICKIYVAFSLRTSQNKLKTKGYEEQGQKSKNNIRVALSQKTAGKERPEIQRMAQFLEGDKNGHFVKAVAKQIGHKWSILGLSLKIPKKHPLKSLELVYAENCSKTHLILEKRLNVENWQNWPISSCGNNLFLTKNTCPR